MSRETVLAEVSAERDRQDAKWGVTAQDSVADGTGPDYGLEATEHSWRPYSGWADMIRESVDRRAEIGQSEWSLVLLEEVFEALAEPGEVELRAELVQVASAVGRVAGCGYGAECGRVTVVRVSEYDELGDAAAMICRPCSLGGDDDDEEPDEPESFKVPVCSLCRRERTIADHTDYNPAQVIMGAPLGWYSGDDGELCAGCMAKTLRGDR